MLPLDLDALTDRLKAAARELGFALVGVCPAVAPLGATKLGEWLDRGFAGEMAYIAARREAYDHPKHVLDGVRSIVMLGLPYASTEPKSLKTGEGRVSRYAWGAVDYHDIVHDKLKQLIATLQTLAPEAKARGVVDTAPLLEREFAQLAGLGWIGKHTLLINKPAGSYFFLAALLTDQELLYDEPFTADHCGSCRACLDACPTQAFPQPGVLDASRCISYLTIELRGPIPQALRPGIGDWLFGCDVCQDVCPWNQHAWSSGLLPARSASGQLDHTEVFGPSPDSDPVDFLKLFALDEEGFRLRFRHTPLWGAKRRGILRNAAVVLGNQRAAAAVPALISGLNDEEALVRGACAWALGQIGGADAEAALLCRQRVEADHAVLEEINGVLQMAFAAGDRNVSRQP